MVQFKRLSIRDMGVPAVALMQRILNAIDHANASQDVAYVGDTDTTDIVAGGFGGYPLRAHRSATGVTNREKTPNPSSTNLGHSWTTE